MTYEHLTPGEAFDPTKPCQTRDGRRVTMFSSEDDSLIAFVERGQHHPASGGKWALRVYNINGKYFGSEGADSCVDLVNIPTKVKKEGWVNIYPAYNAPKWYGESLPIQKIARQSGIYKTKGDAHREAVKAHGNGVPLPVATVKIEWEEEQ